MRYLSRPSEGVHRLFASSRTERLIELGPEGCNPDDDIADRDGWLWITLRGAGRVAHCSPTGELLSAHFSSASQVSRLAFAGERLETLVVTSASVRLDGFAKELAYCTRLHVQGLHEYRVELGAL